MIISTSVTVLHRKYLGFNPFLRERKAAEYDCMATEYERYRQMYLNEKKEKEDALTRLALYNQKSFKLQHSQRP